MGYRADIDGLRAIAVLGVIAFHTGLGFLPGGYVGVDIFFVISGFLITRIVDREMTEGRFTFRNFYARRIRRIVPALLFVIVAIMPFAWVWLMPDNLESAAQSVIATLLFVSNFWFFIETDYFAAAAEIRPFIHTWSLAIEEQFYLFFPVLFLFATRYGRRAVIALPVVVGVLSLVAAEIAVRVDASAAFYITFFRIWEFVAGILLALTRWRAPDRFASWSGALGLALVAGSMLLFRADTAVPGLMGLFPIVGAVLILADGDRGLAGRVLSWRPLVAVGLISYSTYLWHQPIFAIARLRQLHEPDAATYALLTALTLGLGWLSWRFVEQPFRHPRSVGTRPFAALTTGLIIPLFGFAIFVDREAGVVSRLPAEFQLVLDGHDPYTPRIGVCSKIDEREAGPGRPERCILNPANTGPIVHVVGDSHAGALGESLAQRLAPTGGRVQLTFAGGCVPLDIGMDGHDPTRCRRFRARATALLEEDDDAVRTVVISGYWGHYFGASRFDNQEGATAAIVPLGKMSKVDAAAIRKQATSELSAIVDEQISRGRKVVLVYPVPDQGWHVPRRMALLMSKEATDARPISVSSDLVRAHITPADAVLDAIGERPQLYRVRPFDLFCDRPHAGRCIAESDGLPLYRDDDHVNQRGAHMILDAIPPGVLGAADAAPDRDPQTSELQNR